MTLNGKDLRIGATNADQDETYLGASLVVAVWFQGDLAHSDGLIIGSLSAV